MSKSSSLKPSTSKIPAFTSSSYLTKSILYFTLSSAISYTTMLFRILWKKFHYTYVYLQALQVRPGFYHSSKSNIKCNLFMYVSLTTAFLQLFIFSQNIKNLLATLTLLYLKNGLNKAILRKIWADVAKRIFIWVSVSPKDAESA